eukprot:comp20677_c0_seq1/m.26868 comp20677_c0_seq1/g.26868  ORF comp20677_c0_seq1/g.26868 comp20677_c0_seq1/m.26868 type:complete len:656 (-) comp20677_c0_seq1:210-2177(-)
MATVHVSKHVSEQLRRLSVSADSPVAPVLQKLEKAWSFTASTPHASLSADDDKHHQTEHDDGGDTKSVDIDLDGLDARVQEALDSLSAASAHAAHLESRLEACKRQYREMIADGDARLQAIQKKMGVRAAVEKSKTYYLAQQASLKAQEEGRIAALQYEKATNMYEQAQQQQLRLERDLIRRAEDGEHVVIGPTTQDALNTAALRVEECRMELVRVDREHKHATVRVVEARAKMDAMYNEKRASIEKAQQYYDAKEMVEAEILQSQSTLDSLIHEAANARAEVSRCLQVLAEIARGVGGNSCQNPPNTQISRRLSAEVLQSVSKSPLPLDLVLNGTLAPDPDLARATLRLDEKPHLPSNQINGNDDLHSNEYASVGGIPAMVIKGGNAVQGTPPPPPSWSSRGEHGGRMAGAVKMVPVEDMIPPKQAPAETAPSETSDHTSQPNEAEIETNQSETPETTPPPAASTDTAQATNQDGSIKQATNEDGHLNDTTNENTTLEQPSEEGEWAQFQKSSDMAEASVDQPWDTVPDEGSQSKEADPEEITQDADVVAPKSPQVESDLDSMATAHEGDLSNPTQPAPLTLPTSDLGEGSGSLRSPRDLAGPNSEKEIKEDGQPEAESSSSTQEPTPVEEKSKIVPETVMMEGGDLGGGSAFL